VIQLHQMKVIAGCGWWLSPRCALAGSNKESASSSSSG
jgi:hypothetical protein